MAGMAIPESLSANPSTAEHRGPDERGARTGDGSLQRGQRATGRVTTTTRNTRANGISQVQIDEVRMWRLAASLRRRIDPASPSRRLVGEPGQVGPVGGRTLVIEPGEADQGGGRRHRTAARRATLTRRPVRTQHGDRRRREEGEHSADVGAEPRQPVGDER